MITVMVTTKSNKSNTSNNGGCGVYAMQMSNMARFGFSHSVSESLLLCPGPRKATCK